MFPRIVHAYFHSPSHTFLFCKTQLARAIAGEANAAFISVSPSDILSKFVGESESAVRNTFRRATDMAMHLESKCAVVCFDEIDALVPNRANVEGEVEKRLVAQLLMEPAASMEAFWKRAGFDEMTVRELMGGEVRGLPK